MSLLLYFSGWGRRVDLDRRAGCARPRAQVLSPAELWLVLFAAQSGLWERVRSLSSTWVEERKRKLLGILRTSSSHPDLLVSAHFGHNGCWVVILCFEMYWQLLLNEQLVWVR